jgi:hypothetical protein
MKILKVAVARGLATSLSGCLSDESSDFDFVDETFSLIERAEGGAELVTADIDSLPSTATMTGVIGVLAPENRAFLGQMSVEADFDDSTMTGSTSDLGLWEYTGDCVSRETCEATKLSSLDGGLTLDAVIGDSNGDGSGNAIFSGGLNGVVDGDYSDDYVDGTYSAVINLDVVDGMFYQDADGLLMAGSNLTGTVDYVFTDEDGTGYSGGADGLAGAMIVAE